MNMAIMRLSMSATETPTTDRSTPTPEPEFLARVMVTGATGFVGRAVVRELIAKGHTPVCLVRDREQFLRQAAEYGKDRFVAVGGDLFDEKALAKAAEGAQAAIHLVGIITQQRLKRQNFHRIHVEGTRRVLDACKGAGIKRYCHMSALGTRANAVSEYHQTKWLAEGYVRDSGLDWTIFRPSIIHGPDGEFMRMMRTFVTKVTVPVLGVIPSPFPFIPYFGDGLRKLQPVSVKDVAHCFVAALSMPETVAKVLELGGPEAMTWRQFYLVCKETIPGAKAWKPIVGQPVALAKAMALTLMKLPLLPRDMRFNVGQVQMSQEDSVCDIAPVEKSFGIKLRDFREELREYAAMIE
jgi:uncharacterized protein YbjT (DUF2867 family)